MAEPNPKCTICYGAGRVPAIDEAGRAVTEPCQCTVPLSEARLEPNTLGWGPGDTRSESRLRTDLLTSQFREVAQTERAEKAESALRTALARIAELEAELRSATGRGDELSDRLDLERHYHDETRGYRQHAEQRVAELEAEGERMRLEMAALAQDRRIAMDGAGLLSEEVDRLKGLLNESATAIEAALESGATRDGETPTEAWKRRASAAVEARKVLGRVKEGG